MELIKSSTLLSLILTDGLYITIRPHTCTVDVAQSNVLIGGAELTEPIDDGAFNRRTRVLLQRHTQTQ